MGRRGVVHTDCCSIMCRFQSSFSRNTGVENLGIIFEFSPWVLKICPEDGLKVWTQIIDSESVQIVDCVSYFVSMAYCCCFFFQIFTEDLTEVETLPRPKVLHFLKEGFKELAIPYLEHIIYVWEDKGPEFHNVLIQLYLERVQSLMKQYLNSLPEGLTRAPVDKKNQTNPLFCCFFASSKYK